MKKRNLKIVLVLAVLLLAVVIVYVKYKKEPASEPVQEISLEETVERIDQTFKTALLYEANDQEEKIAEVVPESLKAWEEFVSAFKDEQPKEYRRTRNWDRKLLEILEHERLIRIYGDKPLIQPVKAPNNQQGEV